LAGGAADFVADEELGGEMDGGAFGVLDPELASDHFLAKLDGLAVVNVGLDDDRGDALFVQRFERKVCVEEVQAEVFKPANVDDIINVLGGVDFVGLDPYGQFNEKRAIRASRFVVHL